MSSFPESKGWKRTSLLSEPAWEIRGAICTAQIPGEENWVLFLDGAVARSHCRKACGMVGFFTIRKKKKFCHTMPFGDRSHHFCCKISSFFPLRSPVSVYYNSSKTVCPNTCTPVSTAALFTIPKIWKQPKCFPTWEWDLQYGSLHQQERVC